MLGWLNALRTNYLRTRRNRNVLSPIDGCIRRDRTPDRESINPTRRLSFASRLPFLLSSHNKRRTRMKFANATPLQRHLQCRDYRDSSVSTRALLWIAGNGPRTSHPGGTYRSKRRTTVLMRVKEYVVNETALNVDFADQLTRSQHEPTCIINVDPELDLQTPTPLAR